MKKKLALIDIQKISDIDQGWLAKILAKANIELVGIVWGNNLSEPFSLYDLSVSKEKERGI